VVSKPGAGGFVNFGKSIFSFVNLVKAGKVTLAWEAFS